MRITVIAHPNSKKERIEKDLFDSFHVYVNEPPLEGRANKAIIESLIKYFKIKNNKLILVSGSKSKNKIFEVLL